MNKISKDYNIKKTVLLLHVNIMLPMIMFYILIYNNLDYTYISIDHFIYVLSLSNFLLFIWMLLSWKLVTSKLFDPYITFIIAAFLFNAGHMILEVFNLNSQGILNGIFHESTISITLLYIMIGFIFFHLGAIISSFQIGEKNNKPITISLFDIRMVGWLLLGISLIPSVLLIKESISVVISSGYFGLYGRESTTGFNATNKVLAEFLIPASFFLLAGSKGKRSIFLTSVIIIISYSIIMFILGSRSGAVMPLIAFTWLFDRIIYKIPRLFLLIVGLIMLFIIFPFIGISRNLLDEAQMVNIYDLFISNNPVIYIISEMGQSMKTVAYTLELVPSFREFDLGVGYFYGVLTILPNLFWDLHPTVSHGLAADWLVWHVDSNFASRGGGYGYSFIAEAFLNFGWFGILALAFLGYLFAKFVLWADHSSKPARMAMFACFLSFFLYYARGESASIVRALMWYSFIPYIALYVIGVLRRR